MSFIKLEESFFFCHTVQYVEFPQPGLEAMLPEAEAHSLNHWVTREVRGSSLLFLICWVFFFNYEKTLDFVRFFFHLYWDDYMGFVFHSIAVIRYTKWFSDVKPPLAFLEWIMPFRVLVDLVCWRFEDFCADFQ